MVSGLASDEECPQRNRQVKACWNQRGAGGLVALDAVELGLSCGLDLERTGARFVLPRARH